MIDNELYIGDLADLAELPIPWSKIKGKSVFITGATGLIGSFLTDLLMYRNEVYDDGIKVSALGRNEENAAILFGPYSKSKSFEFLRQDIREPIKTENPADYIIHCASGADPLAYSNDPTGTMVTTFLGMHNLLQFATTCNTLRTLFISSGEVYGTGQDDAIFRENDCGYIDYMNSRACYPSSKRAAETLCAAYTNQYGLDIVVARPCHVYGPTFTPSDSRVFAQFIRRAIAHKDIVMKSKGLQTRSYCYISDAASALLHILFYGKAGNAYNIANNESNVTIRQLATIIARISNQEIRFEVPDDVEKSGYSPVSRALFDTGKLEMLGWRARIGIEEGLARTIKCLSSK